MHSNRAELIFLLAVFVAGAIIFAIGTLLVRRDRAAQEEATPVLSDRADRLEMIERLAMVGQPWCVDELRKVIATDADPIVRTAAEDALLVIGARSG